MQNLKRSFNVGPLPRKYIAILGQKGIKFNEFQKACDDGRNSRKEDTPVSCLFIVKKDGSCKIVKYTLGITNILPLRAFNESKFPIKWLYERASSDRSLKPEEIRGQVRIMLGFLKSSNFRIVW